MTDIQFEELPPIRFEDLPPRKSRGVTRRHGTLAAQLRERPKEWACVSVCGTSNSSASMAHQIRTGTLKAYAPKGSYEASARTVEGENRVYARYVGGVGA